MADSIQIILTISITIITLLLTVIGVQLFFVLRETRKFLKRINIISQELEKIGLNLSHGYSEIIGFFYGLKSLTKVLELFSKKKENVNVKESSGK